MTTIFIQKETRSGETRLAGTPSTIKRLTQKGIEVLIEQGAGNGLHISDESFSRAGARIVPEHEGFAAADIILSVNPPVASQLAQCRPGASLVSFLYPEQHEASLAKAQEKQLSYFAMEEVPRITRAQKLDALSSQGNIAGYKAVLLAAVESPRIFPLLMTAAGTLQACRVVVMGAGVAGLQAVATARRLGALVSVSDIRPAVQEQVESLGATFIEVPTEESMETEGGYASEASATFLEQQAALTREHLVKADVVICSALVKGRKAPVLISEETLKAMKPGCVIVDMAAEQGGNCALTRAGEKVVTHGVTVIGVTNLPASVPAHSTEAYAKNVLHVLLDQPAIATHTEDHQTPFTWNLEDEVVDAALVLHHGNPRSPGATDLRKVLPLRKAENS